jgi:D-alanyl-D-alanine carboxypeptidase/D-alanyl-D-alanine-endopeptidase (penicillin-binding protein 4)
MGSRPPSFRGRRAGGLLLGSAAIISLLAAPAAGAAPPDVPGRTPVAASTSVGARSSISATKLRRGLARKARRVGGVSGVWVKDLTAGRVLFKRLAIRRLPIASNMKLFTTGAAITRFGTTATLDTSAWALGAVDEAGVLRGRLLLRGGGDPTLTAVRLAKLAARVKLAGVRRVTGRLVFDDSIFDRRRTVPSAGITGGPYLGSLSGLSFDWGFNRRGRLLKDPARTAARKFLIALRRRGIRIPGPPKRQRLRPQQPAVSRLALVRSSSMSALIAATNQPSDNFLAEMLTKALGAHFQRRGTTAAGVKLIQGFASARGARVKAENGSGLSREDRASARGVGRFLAAMRSEGGVSDTFLGSLAVAGRTGTLADRMRGTAAQDRCRAKTGTLTAVSVLSGYCIAPGGREIAFSILMNKVDIHRAHVHQDKMAALIAQYRP